jgi:hypothetical protein
VILIAGRVKSIRDVTTRRAERPMTMKSPPHPGRVVLR